VSEGIPAHVSLYDVAVGMALVSEDARNQLRNVDELFAAIHAFGEGRKEEPWESLIRNLLGDPEHPATHDAQGDWKTPQGRFSRLYLALIHRVKSIGGYRSATWRQSKAACIRRALSAVMSSPSITALQKLIPSIAPTPKSCAVPQIESKNGSPTPGGGEPASESPAVAV
jgi:hypothetical protein